MKFKILLKRLGGNMILVIQYKSRFVDHVNYSVLGLDDLQKVAVKLREAIDLSAEEQYVGVGYIYLEFYKDGEKLSGEPGCHKYVHTALTSIMIMMEKHQ